MAAVPSIGRATLVEAPRVAPQAAATQDLYERHAVKIQNYCRHQLGSREEAEDAVQTTFMNAFRALGRGVTPESEAAWLFKIAENVCLSRRRSSWRRGRIESPSDFELIEEVVPGPSRQLDELIGIEDALAAMPEQQRRAILLREWQGLSYREIGEELDVSQSAVETLIFRARRSLARGLEQPESAKPKRKSFRRALHAFDAGSVLAAIKTVLAGGAAAKATAAAVAVTAVAGTVAAVEPSVRRDPPSPPAKARVVTPAATPAGPAGSRSVSPSAASARAARRTAEPASSPRGVRLTRPPAFGSSPPARVLPGSSPAAPAAAAPADTVPSLPAERDVPTHVPPAEPGAVPIPAPDRPHQLEDESPKRDEGGKTEAAPETPRVAERIVEFSENAPRETQAASPVEQVPTHGKGAKDKADAVLASTPEPPLSRVVEAKESVEVKEGRESGGKDKEAAREERREQQEERKDLPPAVPTADSAAPVASEGGIQQAVTGAAAAVGNSLGHASGIASGIANGDGNGNGKDTGK